MDGASQVKIACLGALLYCASFMAARSLMPGTYPVYYNTNQHITPKIPVRASDNQSPDNHKKTDQTELSRL
jgi:hypothetical protein